MSTQGGCARLGPACMTHPAGPEPTTPEAPATPGDGEPARGPLPGHPHHPQAVHLLPGLLLPTPSPQHTLLVSAARLGSFLHRVQAGIAV